MPAAATPQARRSLGAVVDRDRAALDLPAERRGAARHEWEHSIPPVEGLRYSVTFRSFVAGFGALTTDANSIQTGA